MSFIKSYYDLLFTAAFIVYCLSLETHTPFHIVVAILSVGFCTYSKYISNKGKILDKDMILEKQEQEHKILLAKLQEIENKAISAEKIAKEAEQRVGLMSPKAFGGLKEAKW